MNEYKDTKNLPKNGTSILPKFDLESIGNGSIRQEAKAHQEAFTGSAPSYQDVLDKLLDQVAKIDFVAIIHPGFMEREELLKEMYITGPEGNTIENPDMPKEKKERLEQLRKMNFKISQKEKKVVVVDQLQKIAKRNQWGLCQSNGFIYVYNGCYWKRIDEDTLKTFLGKVAEKMGIHWIESREANFKIELVKQFFADMAMSKPQRTKGKVLINFQNGTLEIVNGKYKLREFRPRDFLTYQLPFNYDPKATAPMWTAYLNEMLPDVSRQKVLAEFIGHIFDKTGTLKPEKALLLLGEGSNGKSVFYDVVFGVLGGDENVSGYTFETLTSVQAGGSQRANIVDKLLNYGSELSTKLDPNMVKALISGEPVEARPLYQQGYMIEGYAKFVFNCNQLPKDTEQTHAFFRRFLIIPFDTLIPDAKQDKNLGVKIIQSELPGVFNWIMEGLDRYLDQKGHFTDCEAAAKQLAQYKLESDSVKMFLHENSYVPDPLRYEFLKELYTTYRSFCAEDGFKPVQKTNFKKRLTSSKFLVDGRLNRVYLRKEIPKDTPDSSSSADPSREPLPF
jgi:putative DNA primase/helicase